jgi:hypothetical protein
MDGGVEDAAANVACSTATVANALCCASANWPSEADCSCRHYGCSTRNDGIEQCSCGVYPTPPSTNGAPSDQCPNMLGICCRRRTAAMSECRCWASTYCESDEDIVDSCTPATQGCPAGEHPVTSCSP